MSENNSQQPTGPQFALQRIYLKDCSFEAPNTPVIFTQKWEPEVNVDLNAAGKKVEENVYEVVLSVTVTAKLGDKTAYLAEVQQGGIFVMAGMPEADIAALIHTQCANILFPYAREAISDLIGKGSFPQMLLSPVNFDALYAQHIQQQQAKQQGEGGESESAVH